MFLRITLVLLLTMPCGGQDLRADVAKAAAILVSQQDQDGAWRSKMYGLFADGPTLSPLVCATLSFAPGDEAKRSLAQGRKYLASWVDEEGDLRVIPADPAYSLPLAAWVLAQEGVPAEYAKPQAALLRLVRARQLTQANGWRREDAQFGGWSYFPRTPVRPDDDEASGGFEANLSATLFAVGALRMSRVEPSDPAIRAAVRFVERCQNFPEPGDGGFFFSPSEPGRNKAGDFTSYGSMTADGLRALLRCGLPLNDARVEAARAWLVRNFDATRNPGDFAPDREVLRDGYYFYWVWSASHAFMHLPRELCPPNWDEAIQRELLSRQREDGSWSNRFTDGREDDPIIATSFAAASLLVIERVRKEN